MLKLKEIVRAGSTFDYRELEPRVWTVVEMPEGAHSATVTKLPASYGYKVELVISGVVQPLSGPFPSKELALTALQQRLAS